MIVSIDADLDFSAKTINSGLNSPWAMPGNWGKETPHCDENVKYNKDTHKYVLQNSADLSLTMTAADCSNTPPS